MATKKLTAAETLELYRVSLENVGNMPEKTSVMAEFGYDAETINQGRSLFASARQTFDLNKTEDNEMPDAYHDFATKKEQLEAPRATYLKEKGVSQVATQTKDMALDALTDWMREF
jgi:hypothetical protein